jgi:hypothetical protein
MSFNRAEGGIGIRGGWGARGGGGTGSGDGAAAAAEERRMRRRRRRRRGNQQLHTGVAGTVTATPKMLQKHNAGTGAILDGWLHTTGKLSSLWL